METKTADKLKILQSKYNTVDILNYALKTDSEKQLYT